MPVDSEEILGTYFRRMALALLESKIFAGVVLTNGIATAERQRNRQEGKCGREEPLWSWVGLLKVDDFRAGPVGEVGSIFKIYRQACNGGQEPDEPVDHRQPDRAGAVEDSRCCRSYLPCQ